MPRFELEEKDWNSSVSITDVKVHNIESGESKIVKRPTWPRIKSPMERVWEKFYSSIVEPFSGNFYPERDLQGNIIEPSDGGSRARYIVSQIIRLKNVNGQEYLYSIGTILGFNGLGVLVSFPCSKPETFMRTFFDKERSYDTKTGRIVEKVKSPIGLQEQYLLPFSPEAVDELFAKTIKKNTPQVYIKRRGGGTTAAKLCSFVVKDELSNVAITVEWGDTNRTLDLFKNKSFEYLFNGEYIPEPVKAEMRARTEGLTGEKIQPSPKIQDNSSSSTTSTNNNNSKDYSAYK